MSTKHTPKPWTYSEQAGRFFVGSPRHFDLAVVADEPDACLIVAAPEMLEALEMVNSSIDEDYFLKSIVLVIIRAVIAKAKGEK